jgi:hypothetical protein
MVASSGRLIQNRDALRLPFVRVRSSRWIRRSTVSKSRRTPNIVERLIPVLRHRVGTPSAEHSPWSLARSASASKAKRLVGPSKVEPHTRFMTLMLTGHRRSIG